MANIPCYVCVWPSGRWKKFDSRHRAIMRKNACCLCVHSYIYGSQVVLCRAIEVQLDAVQPRIDVQRVAAVQWGARKAEEHHITDRRTASHRDGSRLWADVDIVRRPPGVCAAYRSAIGNGDGVVIAHGHG